MTREMMDRILAAVPGFRPSWERFLAQWGGEEYLPWYSAMGDLAHYIVDRHEHGDRAELAALFAVVEELLDTDDPELTNLIAVGLLEDIQNVSSHRTFAYAEFRTWFGSRTLREWEGVEAGMREVSDWLNKTFRRHWWQLWRPKSPLRGVSRAEIEAIKSPELKRLVESSHRASRRI